MKEEAVLIDSKVDTFKTQHVELQKEYKHQKKKHEEAELMKDSYEHMYDRMRVFSFHFDERSDVRSFLA